MNMEIPPHVESSASRVYYSRLSDEAMRLMHQNWMRKYDYEYDDDEEEERRFKIFKETFEAIEKHNIEEESCLLLLSPYSDRTDAEFFALYSDIQGEVPEDMLDDVALRKSRQHVECDADKRRFQSEQLEEELEKKKQQRISEVSEV